MKQDTGRGEMVEAFIELLEARAELSDIHLMTFDEHMIFCMLTGVQDKGMLTEWRHIETPTKPEMKHVMKIYMNAKKQEKATRNCPYENARAAKAGEKSRTAGRYLQLPYTHGHHCSSFIPGPDQSAGNVPAGPGVSQHQAPHPALQNHLGLVSQA